MLSGLLVSRLAAHPDTATHTAAPTKRCCSVHSTLKSASVDLRNLGSFILFSKINGGDDQFLVLSFVNSFLSVLTQRVLKSI